MSLNKMAQECHEISVSKGWHERPACAAKGDPSKLPLEEGHQPSGVDYDRVAAYIALLHSEASEALEELRRDREPSARTMQMYFARDKDGNLKPEGVAVELVDLIIRALDDAAALGLDLDSAYEAKLAYNRTRPARHGGKNM